MVSDLKLELTLAWLNEPFTTAAPNWTLNKAELMLEYVQVQDSAFSMVSQMNPEGNKIWFDHFFAFSSTIPTGTSSIDTLIPTKSSRR